MSFGKNKSESSQTFDPQLKAALMDVFNTGKNIYNTTEYAPYNAATVSPFSPLQLAGMQGVVDAAQAGIGQNELMSAINTTGNLTNFNPLAVNADTFGMDRVTSRDIGPGFISEERINPFAAINAQNIGADSIAAERFRDQSLTPYMNTFEDTVVDSALGDIERARQMQQNQNAASAISAGAFGGDRQGIVEAETNRAALEQAAKTAAGLRQSGFESAAKRLEADANRGLTADRSNQQSSLAARQSNQGANLTAARSNLAAEQARATQNAQNALRARLANQSTDLTAQGRNQDAALRAGLANQSTRFQTGRANQDARLRAALANQNAVSDAARLRMNAANQLGSLGQDLRGTTFADMNAILGVGDMQQDQSQRILDDLYRRFQEERDFPLRMFDVLRGAAGILPNPLTSSSSQRGFNIGVPGAG
tara:strand:+ start:4360 stop:5631 length:1272 start_codon:yes stop_codon:yes gene_type:complete